MDKFKAYQQQMEKALRAFEYTTEWADLVNALGKVNKVLLNYSQFSKIPCDAILGRRLAQCLHPGLPNGVQLKALETYDLLFKAIGSENLMQELSKFSNGLFPLLSHADLNVKPALLELYEVHFLPLNERLRPALDGFLIATLHGLEENTDFYQRTDDLLMKVCAGVGPEFFYGSLWRCILIDPSVRLHGMNFLITHFNKKRPLESQMHILGNSSEALIEAICVSLLDIRNVLVQRAALDLLLCCFPLHNQQIMRHEMIKLATGAVTVLLRRDTSLSRRLLAWIFNLDSSSGKKTPNLAIYGPNSASSSQTTSLTPSEPRKSREQREKERKVSYFNEYAKPLLLEAFNNCLSDPSKVIDIPNCWSSLGDFWCYRLLICLIDHSELCEIIIDDLCLDILRALCIDFHREANQRPEFIRTIRLLLNSMNISYLWGRVYNLLVEVCTKRKASKDDESTDSSRELVKGIFHVKNVGSGETNILELCASFDFMMECYPIENYIEVAKEFLPRILINLLNLMIDYCDILKVDEYLSLTRVVANIFEGVSLLHQDDSLLKRAELAQNSLNQVPTPVRSNQISLVAEDEEYLAEENVDPSNDSSNNVTDETGEKSISEPNISHTNQLDLEEKGATPTMGNLIEKFQYLFHSFVTRRLLKQENLSSVYEEFTKLLELSYLDRRQDNSDANRLEADEGLVVVYESFCKVLTSIESIPVVEDVLNDSIDESIKFGSQHGSDARSVKTRAAKQTEPIRADAEAELTVQENSPKEEQSEASPKKLKFPSCKPYIQDLMLLSYKVNNIKINYASMSLLLDMLSTSQLALDADFALSNQLVASVVPSFSEELNASVVGDLISERSTPTKSTKRLLLTDEEFYFIVKETCWFSLAMKILWQYLSTAPTMWLDTVELIQNMHNLTHQTLVCEDIICASLNSSDEQVAYDARRRFILLFSLMKSERSELNLKQREFERPLFFMLDSLTNKIDPFNCIAKDWLTQVYKFRTTARVLEPILKILLHPDTARTPIIFTKINISSLHHTHMHLYSQIYDSQRILYALNTLWNVLTTDPQQGLIRMANSSIKGCHELHLLYAKHCYALAGNNFHDEVSVDSRGQVPSFLELTIITCLNFLSSYYMQLPSAKLSQADLHGNQKVRMLASEILRTIFSNLFDAIKGCPTHPIHDMLNRCKAQEIILLHIATSVQCAQHAHQINQPSSSEQLIHFNETSKDNSDDFQRTLLRLLEELMILEYRVAPPNVISETENHSRSARTRDIPDISSSSLKYFYNILISSQRLFLSSVKAALQNIQRSDLHVNWVSMIETTIPISGRSLTRWIVCVISRLCDNLEMISNCILDRCEPISISLTMTPKYLSILMNSLTHLTHYCLLDIQHNSTQSGNLSQRSESLSTLLPSTMNSLSYGGISSGSSTTLTSAGTSGPSSLGPVSHVMSNILHVFSNDQSQDSGLGSQSSASLGQSDPIMVARKEVLNKLSQIIFALIQVWKAMSREQNSWVILGAPAEVKKQILSLLSPISLRYGVQFMNAISFVWHELRSKSVSRKDVIPPCSADQSLLVEIVASISDLPMESVLQTTRQVISKTQESRSVRRVPLEVGLLQFFLAYIRLFPGSQLIECWKPLLHLLRDGLQLVRPAMPQAQFTLLALLHEFVQTAPLIEDRKDQKDLQDVAQKLIDSLTSVVGARLAQTRWLRRALEVEPGPQHEVSEDDESPETATGPRSLQPDTSSIFSGESRSSEHFTDADSAITTTSASIAASAATNATANQIASQTHSNGTGSNANDDNSYLAKYSVQALNALAEYVAPVLDVVYASDEKEKVVNLINGIIYYVIPYLKNHHKHNSPSFLACSHLLSSISGYQYTRKAWRKETLELLLDPQFFQMDSRCMEHWRVIVDHLMTHDKTTFRDFLARMSLNQSGGALKLFASRDQESEQRAQLIKRMAFILFCSERDQYHKYTPEIQEKLIESLRDNPSDLVQSQIMLCFRVLIIRSSAHLLTSLWPFVYTEMVQGLLDIESYLEQSIAVAAAANADQQQIQSNLQVGSSTFARFQLFLYTCKLLDMVLALPADSLPQFQMYRWSFIGAGDDFEPHLVRIERRLSELSACPTILPYRSHYPILTVNKISNLLDLHPFFKTLVKVNRNEYELVQQDQPPLVPLQQQLSPSSYDDPIKFIDAILENSFDCAADDWLTRVFKAKVPEPVLKILLHPDTARTPIIFTKINISSLHHTHMHLYSQIYDSQRILYALNTLWNVLTTDPQQGLIRMANSSIKGCHELHLLYAKHCYALAGNNFHDEVSVDSRGQVPSFLELTIITCLNFLSSYYMQLPSAKLSQADLHGNQKVRMLASEILRTIFSNLFDAIKGCPTHPIHDMLNRCKAQEIILLHIATSVQCAQHAHQINQPSSSEQLIHFNETSKDNSDDFQRTLLRLLEELMILEYRVAPPNVISETENHSRSARTRDIPDISSSSLKYFYNILISSQRLFLSSVKAALQNIQRSDLHVNWVSMIETTIPISGRSLTRWIVCVISRLCDNLEMISNCILDRCEPISISLTMTPKYLSILMNSLTHLTHYCLLDIQHNSTQSGNLSQRSESLSTLLPSTMNSLSYGGISSGSSTTLTSAGTSGPSSLGPVSHVMSNILHVFSNDQSQDSGLGSQSSASLGQSDPIMVARKEVLNKLSQIIFALIQVWKAMSREQNSWVILGAPAEVKKQILSLLSPISLRYGVQFMNAISFVWHELRSKSVSRKDVIPPCSADQSLLVEIVASISDLPMESVLQTTRQVISKTQESRSVRRVPLEVGLLQFFLAYIRLFPGSQLIECWKPLLHLLRDGLQLVRPAMPQAQFTLLALLHEFVQTAPLIEDRKDQKDLQDVAQKLIDSLTSVVGARLAQTRWLRRALEVEPGPQHEVSEDDESPETATGPRSLQPDTSSIFSGESRSSEHFTDADSAITTTSASIAASAATNATANQIASQTHSNGTGSNANDDNSYLAKYSVQALNALAEYVAPVLDVVYASDEKEKVVNLINGIIYYVIPYLKNHHKHNSPSFLACSHLLSSISGYQYTRKAWRKETLELLLDPQFFQMDSRCMEHWRVIVDHLMTHDKTTFRDFLARMSLNQSGGALKLFASRDQESEQRAQLIKRMAFILFCSERDQYHKYTPEIQEKLIESLRDNPSDLVQSQIMLCFRVLIIRSSAHLLTSLWPFVYTEMVQGLLDIESYLEQSIAVAAAANADQQQIQSNLQVGSSTFARFQLFLYTCKLLDMVLALPADSLPQFQMYRWSFIGAGDDFEPHLVRIERRLSELSACPTPLPYQSQRPIIKLKRLNNLLDLHPFFRTLIKLNWNEYEAPGQEGESGQQQRQHPIRFIDAILESDFVV